MLLSYLIIKIIKIKQSIKRLSKVSNNDLMNHLTKFYLFLKINNLQSKDFVFIAAIKY